MEEARKKILIVCSHLFNDTDANAICVRNIIKEMTNYELFIITDNDKGRYKNFSNDNIHYYFIKESFYERLLALKKTAFNRMLITLFSFLRRVFNLFIYPNVSPVRSKRILRLAKDIVKNNKISIYLATYRPFESIACGFALKKIFNDMEFISYHLDNLEDNAFKNILISKILKKKSIQSFAKENLLFDKIYITYSSELISKKTIKIGLPLYKNNELIQFDFKYNKQYINLVYIGSLDIYNRNPEYAFSILQYYNNHCCGKKIKVNFWGWQSGLDSMLQNYKDLVTYNGMVENRYVQYLYESSDYILNIGNSITLNMIPSKLFHIFATGKPVISFNDQRDISINYLKKYKNASIIMKNEPINHSYMKLGSMLNQEFDKSPEMQKEFEMFRPKNIVRELFYEN